MEVLLAKEQNLPAEQGTPGSCVGLTQVQPEPGSLTPVELASSYRAAEARARDKQRGIGASRTGEEEGRTQLASKDGRGLGHVASISVSV